MTKLLDWGKSTPKPHYRYINGKVSKYNGPIICEKISVFNSGPFGLRFVGTPPPSFVVQKMFELMSMGCVSNIFSIQFKKEKEKSFWSKLWKWI